MCESKYSRCPRCHARMFSPFCFICSREWIPQVYVARLPAATPARDRSADAPDTGADWITAEKRHMRTDVVEVNSRKENASLQGAG